MTVLQPRQQGTPGKDDEVAGDIEGRVESVGAVAAGDPGNAVGIVGMALVNIVFVKNIFQFHVLPWNIRCHVVIEPLGNGAGAPSGPVIVPGAVLWLAGIGIGVAVNPVMLVERLHPVYPYVVGRIVKFGGIPGVEGPPSVAR